jgi:hypothetical protein
MLNNEAVIAAQTSASTGLRKQLAAIANRL